MPTFGQYETVQVPYRGPRTTLYLARKLGTNDDPKVAIKVLDVQAIIDRDQVQQVSERFLASAKLQKSLTESGAKHWAAVREFGTSPAGVYYATEYYPKSVAKLLDGQVRLSGRAIHHIVMGVVQGLGELRGRGHGGLKPTRVLIGQGVVERAKVVLTSARIDAQAGAEGELDDLRAVGRMVFQMLFFQPYRELGGWPVADSPEFAARFGDKAEGWRALLNRLLNPSTRPGELPLSEVQAELASLRPSGGGSSGGGGGGKKIVLIGAAAIVIAGAGVGGYLALSGGSGGTTPSGTNGGGGGGIAQDDEIVPRYFARVWVARELEALANIVEPLAVDPWWTASVREPLAPVAAGSDFTSDTAIQRATGRRGGLLTVRSASLSDVAPSARDIGALVNEDDRVSAVFAAIDLSAWPALRQRTTLIERLNAVGLLELSERLAIAGTRLALAPPFDGSDDALRGWRDDVTDAVREVAGGAADVTRAIAALDRIDALRAALVQTNDDLLALYPGSIDASDGLLTLDAIVPQLESRAELGERLRAMVATLGGSVPDGLRAQPLYDGIDGEAAGRQLFDDWLDLAANRPAWERIEMPAWVATLRGRATRLKEQALGVAEAAAPEGVNDEQWRRTADAASEAARDIESIALELARLDARGAQALDGDAFDTRLADLERDLEGTLDEQAELVRMQATAQDEAQRLLAQVQEELRAEDTIAASRAVNEWWIAQRDRAIAQFRADAPSLQQRAQQLRDVGADAEVIATRAIEAAARSLPPWVDPAEFEQLEQAKRERVLAESLSSWRPGVDAEELGIGQALGPWLEDIIAGIAAVDAARLSWERDLEGAEALDGVLARLAGEPWWDELRPVIAGQIRTRDRIVGMRERAADAWLDAAGGERTDLPMRLLAWDLLGQQPDWPAPGVDLRRDAAATRALLEGLDRHDDSAAAQRVRQRVQAESRERLTRALVAADSRDELRSVEEAASALGLAADELDTLRGRYNLAVLRFDAARESAGNSSQRLRPAIERFLVEVQGLEGEVGDGQRAAIAALRAALEKQPERGGAEELANVGPGAAGWRLVQADIERPVYRAPSGSVELAFRRLQVGSRTVYLGETEVSIEQFGAIIASDPSSYYASIGSRLWTGFPPETAGQLQQDVRGWRWNQQTSSLEASTFWLDIEVDGTEDKIAIYSRNPRVQPSPPTPRTPMTTISSIAADVAAQRAGCRLPTLSEWQAAARALGMGPSAGWNVRDATVRDQQAYLRSEWTPRQASLSLPLGATPDRNSYAEIDANTFATQNSDGELWFWGVDQGPSGAAWRNLYGNVAEFVNSGRPFDVGNLQQSARAADYAVIGGSALSSVPADEPVSIAGVARLKAAFADVGFRLAFEAEVSEVEDTLVADVSAIPMDRFFAFN